MYHSLQRYNYTEPKYITLYNLGYLKSSSLNEKVIYSWIDKQKKYIHNLALEEKSGLLLWQKHPEIFQGESKEAIDRVTLSKYHLIHPDEDLPSIKQLDRYKNLLKNVLLKSPKLPFNIILGVKLCNPLNPFYELSFDTNSKQRFLEKGTTALYIGAIYEGDLLFLSPDYKTFNKVIPISDDKLYLNTSIKETLEEANIDLNKIGKIIEYVDFPIYKQDIENNQVKISLCHGTCASGTTIICQDDFTILCFLRSSTDFNSTWCGVGGAIGYDTTKTYNSNFNFRSYIVLMSSKEKEYINQTMKLNHENSIAVWFDLKELLEQMAILNKLCRNKNINNYLINLPNPITYEEYKNVFREGVKNQNKFLYLLHPDGKYYLTIPSLTYIINVIYKNLLDLSI